MMNLRVGTALHFGGIVFFASQLFSSPSDRGFFWCTGIILFSLGSVVNHIGAQTDHITTLIRLGGSSMRLREFKVDTFHRLISELFDDPSGIGENASEIQEHWNLLIEMSSDLGVDFSEAVKENSTSFERRRLRADYSIQHDSLDQ